jgi:hypothetical protein
MGTMAVKQIAEASPRSMARLAGVLYLLIIVGSLMIPFAVPVPSGMMRPDMASPTADQIVASNSLRLFGGIAQLAIVACDICVALIFYQLLKPVSRSLSLLAAFFRLVFVAIASANVLNQFAPLILLTRAEYRPAFNPDQLQALALVFLRLRTIGFDIALVFFGLHCMILGYLLFKSTFFPRVLGGLLGIGGVGYVINIFAGAMPPAMRGLLFPYVVLVAGIAETVLTLWLIIVGVNASKWKVQASAAGMRT